MRYLPLSKEDRLAICQFLAIESETDLFDQDLLRSNDSFSLPNHQSEHQILKYFTEIHSKNDDPIKYSYFLGSGCYRHYVPSAVDHIIQRSEFLTAYTPYQAEVSQATLKGIFDFQSMITQLTKMDVANASLYDGAHSLYESILMSSRINKKYKVGLVNSVNVDYLIILESNLTNFELKKDIDIESLNHEFSSIVIQVPDYYGNINIFDDFIKKAKQLDVMIILVTTEILSLGMLDLPDDIDVFVGEAQSIGISPSFGGPHLGFFSTKKKYIRQMPGRICGKTKDINDKEGYVLTLNAREQHIRRGKATSDVCSNQGLNMLAFVIHMYLLGRTGLKKLALLNHSRAQYLANQLKEIDNVEILNKSFFNEFTIKTNIESTSLVNSLYKMKIFAGVALEGNKVLIAVTEQNSKAEIDRYVSSVDKILNYGK